MTNRKKTAPKKEKATKKKALKDNLVKKKTIGKDVTKNIANKSIVLDSVLTINHAKALLQEFNQLLKKNGDINIDVSAVEMIDTAMLQMLLAISNKVRSSEHEVHWINPSDIFISNVSLLGLSKLLKIS